MRFSRRIQVLLGGLTSCHVAASFLVVADNADQEPYSRFNVRDALLQIGAGSLLVTLGLAFLVFTAYSILRRRLSPEWLLPGALVVFAIMWVGIAMLGYSQDMRGASKQPYTPNDGDLVSTYYALCKYSESGQVFVESAATTSSVRDLAKHVRTAHGEICSSTRALTDRLKIIERVGIYSRYVYGGEEDLREGLERTGLPLDYYYPQHVVALHQELLNSLDSAVEHAPLDTRVNAIAAAVRPELIKIREQARAAQEAFGTHPGR
jgi:predicted outer membrane protein